MRIKLNYSLLLDPTAEQWAFLANAIIGEVKPNLRETLEAILQQHGAVIDARERLFEQPVVYAELESGLTEGFNGQLRPYGIIIEPQTPYSSKEKD